jgi:hypothetical protein
MPLGVIQGTLPKIKAKSCIMEIFSIARRFVRMQYTNSKFALK